MAAAPAAAAATTACTENPLFPVAMAGAAAVALPATTADGGAGPAARQPAPLQAAPVAAAQRVVLSSCPTSSFSTAAPVGVGARASTGRVNVSAALSPAATPGRNAAPRRWLCGAAAATAGSPFPNSAGWVATPSNAPGEKEPRLLAAVGAVALAADGDRVAALVGGAGRAAMGHSAAAPPHPATAAPRTTGLSVVGRCPLGAGGRDADATSPPPAVTSGAAPPGSAPRNAAWKPAAAVSAAAAVALPARSAVETAADADTSPCLSAAARAAAATALVAWAAGGAAPAARPLVGTPAVASRLPGPSISAAVGSPPPLRMTRLAVFWSPECEVPPRNKQATTASNPMGN